MAEHKDEHIAEPSDAMDYAKKDKEMDKGSKEKDDDPPPVNPEKIKEMER